MPTMQGKQKWTINERAYMLLRKLCFSLENLAWASVQLHCYRKTNYNTPSTDKTTELADLIGRTALDAVTQAPGEVIVTTKPKILFCDLKLQPGETKMCRCY